MFIYKASLFKPGILAQGITGSQNNRDGGSLLFIGVGVLEVRSIIVYHPFR